MLLSLWGSGSREASLAGARNKRKRSRPVPGMREVAAAHRLQQEERRGDRMGAAPRAALEAGEQSGALAFVTRVF